MEVENTVLKSFTSIELTSFDIDLKMTLNLPLTEGRISIIMESVNISKTSLKKKISATEFRKIEGTSQSNFNNEVGENLFDVIIESITVLGDTSGIQIYLFNGYFNSAVLLQPSHNSPESYDLVCFALVHNCHRFRTNANL